MTRTSIHQVFAMSGKCIDDSQRRRADSSGASAPERRARMTISQWKRSRSADCTVPRWVTTRLLWLTALSLPLPASATEPPTGFCRHPVDVELYVPDATRYLIQLRPSEDPIGTAERLIRKYRLTIHGEPGFSFLATNITDGVLAALRCESAVMLISRDAETGTEPADTDDRKAAKISR